MYSYLKKSREICNIIRNCRSTTNGSSSKTSIGKANKNKKKEFKQNKNKNRLKLRN